MQIARIERVKVRDEANVGQKKIVHAKKLCKKLLEDCGD